MGLEHLDKGRCLAEKDADVPKEITAIEIPLGHVFRWLLDEATHAQGREIAPLYLDIAVAGMRAVGFHPEDHQHPVFGCVDGRLDPTRERLRIGHDVIRRSKQHDGFGTHSLRRSARRCRLRGPCLSRSAQARCSRLRGRSRRAVRRRDSDDCAPTRRSVLRQKSWVTRRQAC